MNVATLILLSNHVLQLDPAGLATSVTSTLLDLLSSVLGSLIWGRVLAPPTAGGHRQQVAQGSEMASRFRSSQPK